MEYDRREFIKTVGVATSAMLFSATRAVEAASALEKYVPAYRHALSVDGNGLWEVADFEGGNYLAEVATNYLGPNNVGKKSISSIGVAEVTVLIGAGQDDAVYSWIVATLGRHYQAKTGDLASVDAQGNVRSITTFLDAVITKVVFPELDTRDKTTASIALSFLPGSIRKSTGNGGKINSNPKPWTCSNFRLTIAGLEASCAKVTRIESFSVSQDFTFDNGTTTAGPVNVSDLIFYCPEEFAGDFIDFADDFLGNGHHLDANEKTGTLDFLAPDKKTVLMTLNFSGLGIYGWNLQGETSKTPASRLVKVEMYCESVSLTKLSSGNL